MYILLASTIVFQGQNGYLCKQRNACAHLKKKWKGKDWVNSSLVLVCNMLKFMKYVWMFLYAQMIWKIMCMELVNNSVSSNYLDGQSIICRAGFYEDCKCNPAIKANRNRLKVYGKWVDYRGNLILTH